MLAIYCLKVFTIQLENAHNAPKPVAQAVLVCQLYICFVPMIIRFMSAAFGPAERHFFKYLIVLLSLTSKIGASGHRANAKSFRRPQSGYEPSQRSRHWLKLKKDYLEGVGDSLDLTVIGAYFGNGKRSSFYGSYLLAAYDKETECFEVISRVATGLSDDNLRCFTTQFKDAIIPGPKSYYTIGNVHADVWFEPKYVWEIKCADLSLSPKYPCAMGRAETGKGISLRFPRFIRVSG